MELDLNYCNLVILAISAVSVSFHQYDYSIKILESDDGGSTIGDHDKIMSKLDNLWKNFLHIHLEESNGMR